MRYSPGWHIAGLSRIAGVDCRIGQFGYWVYEPDCPILSRHWWVDACCTPWWHAGLRPYHTTGRRYYYIRYWPFHGLARRKTKSRSPRIETQCA